MLSVPEYARRIASAATGKGFTGAALPESEYWRETAESICGVTFHTPQPKVEYLRRIASTLIGRDIATPLPITEYLRLIAGISIGREIVTALSRSEYMRLISEGGLSVTDSYGILTEGGDQILTEAGDNLEFEH